jgi:predicted transcriptional regulator
MLINDTDLKVFNFIKSHPGQTITQMIHKLGMPEGTVRSCLRRCHDCYDSTRITFDSGGYAFVYFVKKGLDTPNIRVSNVERKKEPIKIKHHPIMKALYGL